MARLAQWRVGLMARPAMAAFLVGVVTAVVLMLLGPWVIKAWVWGSCQLQSVKMFCGLEALLLPFAMYALVSGGLMRWVRIERGWWMSWAALITMVLVIGTYMMSTELLPLGLGESLSLMTAMYAAIYAVLSGAAHVVWYGVLRVRGR